MLRRCIYIEPKFIPAYIELARLRGPKDRSVGSLLRAIVQINPADPNYVTIYGYWLLNRGNRIAALKYYWRALALSPSYMEAMVGAARILRKSGDYGRLFQLVTRWQSILRESRGQPPSKSHLYLYEWQLKNELSNKAKAYDGCPQSCTKRYIIQKSAIVSGTRWNRPCNKTKSRYFTTINRQCRVIRRIQKYRTAAPLLVHQVLDTV
ncbi:hypothetical protein AMK59_6255 [Oryctes borbonicus]|uniref:Tetratricopeptide repeat-containing protein n=1 Tax=Oryctes borbonicus TaxID=1629725 RepID=A0A0T6B1P9_9SCAR|nr:hypothetical protein AMK59_6255 [Oryctes borbonicus]